MVRIRWGICVDSGSESEEESLERFVTAVVVIGDVLFEDRGVNGDGGGDDRSRDGWGTFARERVVRDRETVGFLRVEDRLTGQVAGGGPMF
jgi:hypothetical protein